MSYDHADRPHIRDAMEKVEKRIRDAGFSRDYAKSKVSKLADKELRRQDRGNRGK